MNSKQWFRFSLAGLAILGLVVSGALSQAPDLGQLRAKSQKLMNDGNFREAYNGFQQLALDAKNDPKLVAGDLDRAVQCLNNLGRTKEFDELVEASIKVHKANWRLLQGAATQYTNAQHQGFLIAGNYERGHRRGGGKVVNSVDRDRTRALQLMQDALPLVVKDDNKGEVAQFFLNLSEQMLSNRGIHEAWRLQYLTDLSKLPDLDDGYFRFRDSTGAPVDAAGNPIYHTTSATWEAAETDGQRWRWAQEQAIENSPALRMQVWTQFASFLQQQFGVQTMQRGGFGRNFGGPTRDDDTTKDESGTFALHTLKETETIAKLASGIKRFTLPDEFNHIKLYQKIAAEDKVTFGEQALNQLAQIFENRRQYPTAAKYWQESITRHRDTNDWKKNRLEQIVSNWGTFEAVSTQPAGKGATVDFRFRNGKKVKFDAREIKIDLLLADLKEYLKSDPGNRVDWNRINIGNIGWRIVQQNEQKFLDEAVAAWELDVDPRPDHFDRRVTVTTPLQKPGAYLLTGTMVDGNVSKIILWVADTAIVHKTLEGKQLYFVGDAVNGAPIAEANVEFFGWQQRHLGGNRFQVTTTNFAEKTGPDGLLTPDPKDLKQEFQWLVMARGDKGRMAFFGFQGVWNAAIHDQEYNQVKVFSITDRPVYRPKQKVNFKLWFRTAKYDQPDNSEFAKRSFPIAIFNPKNEKILSKTIETDDFGGLSGEYELPEDAQLGQYRIQLDAGHGLRFQAMGGNHFRVEEYKKPEFEVKVAAPTEPVMLGEKITAKINANYYFGAPVAKGKIKYKVMRSSHSANWFPVASWDWCFGSGYWWFGYDYPWYRGFDEWAGCRRPLPPWIWRGPQHPPEIVAEVEREISPDGSLDVEIDTAIAKELHGDTDHEYTISVEVRDESRRTITGEGKVLVARKPFKVFTWVNRGFYRVGDTVEANFKAQTLDNKPVEGTGVLTLYKITYDDKRQPIETAVRRWELNTNAEGVAQQQMKASAKGQYRLSYELVDSKKHKIEGGYIFTIVGDGNDGTDFRFNNLELIQDKKEYAPGDQLKLQVNTDRTDSTVLLFIRPTNGVYLPPKVLRLKGKSVIQEIEIVKRDMPNFFVEALTIADGNVYVESKEVIVPPEKRILNVEVLPSALTYKPGQKAKVKIKLTDLNGENYSGSTVVSVYDKSVEYVSGGSNVPDIKEFFWKWRRHHNPQTQESLARSSHNMTLPNKPGMSFLGVFGASVADEMGEADHLAANLGDAKGDGGGFGGGELKFARGMAMDGANREASAMPMAAAAPGGDMLADRAGGELRKSMNGVEKQQAGQADKPSAGGGGPLVEPSVRTKFADTAYWNAAISTAKDGTAEIDIDMPENLTGWKIRVWGMGHGTRVGSGDAEVTTRKDLLVRLQAPRFFVQKDEVVLTANVHNYLPKEKEVTVTLEVPGNVLEPISDKTVKIMIPAGGEQRVDWRCKVTSEGEAVVRMKALTDEESDAMEMKLPSYVHGMLKTESWASTIRPDQAVGKVNITVPTERRVEQSVLEIRYSPSLALAMVDALPYLAEYPYDSTDQTLNRFLPSVITQKTLLGLNLDLKAIGEKRTNLNAQEIGNDRERAKQWQRFDRNPVFDEAELTRMVKEGVKALTDQQISDGGWGWFSGSGERSFPHTTATVVRGLQIAKANDVALVPGTLERGIDWLRRYQAQQLELLKNFEQKKEKVPTKQFADAMDAFAYMVLNDAGSDNVEMRDRIYRDRIQIPVYGKAMFGLALDKVGDREKLDMIMQNIDQFLVQDTENETAFLRLPASNHWWSWHGSEIEANAYYLKLLAKTEPKGEKAPRLVKYLLNNRKHATYWQNTRDTALCVEAFADFIRASGEMEPELTVEVWMDGEMKKAVEITKENLFTYDNKFVLSGADVKDGKHEVELRRRGKGPIYFNAYLTNFTLEDHIEKAGLEVNVNRKYYKLNPVDKKINVAGSRGQPVSQKVEKYEREELKELATLKSGDLVEIELEIDSKNDYEYLMFEDMKASGFEPVDLRSGYNSNSLGAYMELRDNRVAFFVRALARGKHSVSYRMRAEIPGKFSALPTRASAVYAPELKGNSDEIKLQIVD
ncbi:MG2 domain protein [Anatilimnocola aggregata]|uniref:MG2 domain protein n=1 Tax=Anatilimnocola aggregata TaxID=2528021 RepID=A0A517YH18_9BACT|nr:MG2 domain-containing protein [Anatilimnocola aggregata]QDU29498.1 MG2 domain protein [Anatilimnocola aggregata]